MGGAKIIDLMNATRSDQPVKTPDEGSNYHLILGNKIARYGNLDDISKDLSAVYPACFIHKHETGARLRFHDGAEGFIRPRLLSLENVAEIHEYFGVE